MSEEQKLIRATQFDKLPNELIYTIFDFLTASDILQAFAHLNDRYNSCVQCYIKRLDLISNWQIDRLEFKWICGSIRALKMDQNHVHFLSDPDDQKSVTSSQSKEGLPQRKQKSLFRSIMTKPFTCFRKTTTTSQYGFPQLHSLHLVNVPSWNKVISDMNLESLSLSFDDDNHDYCRERIIPETVIRFSANTVFEAKSFHSNLINLNVCVRSVIHLLEIVECTPNIKHLSVVFTDDFDYNYDRKNYQSDRFNTLTTNIRLLENLSSLSFSTKQSDKKGSHRDLPFNQIKVFINRCCPDNTILKKVTLKLKHIMFDENHWPTIMQYKNTFHRFDLYASVTMQDRALINRIIPLIDDHFAFHIEDGDPLHAQFCYLHIYSIPFAFNELHGFISCSDLSPGCSYSRVRHLYFTQTYLARPISFESLAQRMPHLISIDFEISLTRPLFSINRNIPYVSDYNRTDFKIIHERHTFKHVRFLRFKIIEQGTAFQRRNNDLLQLLYRMPRLQSLRISIIDVIQLRHLLLSIQQLDLRQGYSSLPNILTNRVPHLSTLFLENLGLNPKSDSQIVGSLFIEFPSLKLVCCNSLLGFLTGRASCKEMAQKMLVRMQKMDERLRHLRLDFGYGTAEFSFRNL